jgi:acyl-CoA thioester hydrolase
MVKTSIRVIYADTDQMGVVYYANYLRFFEAGRNEYLRDKGIPYKQVEAELAVRLPVVEAQVQYKQPARYDDLLEVETAISKLGNASARFEYRVLRGDELVALGHTIHACIGADGRVKRLPALLVAKLDGGG